MFHPGLCIRAHFQCRLGSNCARLSCQSGIWRQAPGAARAWIYSGSTTTGYNVAGIVKTAPGYWVVTMSSPVTMPYAIQLSIGIEMNHRAWPINSTSFYISTGGDFAPSDTYPIMATVYAQ